MTGRLHWWTALATAAWATVGPVVTAHAVGAQETPVFSADVMVETSIVDQQGVVVETRPNTRYRMHIRTVEGERQTEIIYAASRLFPRGPLVDPRAGYRVVFDAGHRNLRIYDASGALVSSADGAPEGFTESATSPGPTFADADRSSRRGDLVRRLGRPVGKLGNRERYVTKERDATVETLVEPDSSLPVEINVVKDGELEHRTAIAYARMPRGRWYIATERTESVLPGAAGRRLVSLRTTTNVTTAEGR